MKLFNTFLLFICIFINFLAHGIDPEATQPIITIWVHGTKQFISKIITPKFFYNRIGMHPANSFDPQYHVRTIADTLYAIAPELFPLEHFYFFGWSGKLSFEERTKSAHNLYEALKTLIKEYQNRYECTPQIRMITHSHGGNVALSITEYINPADSFVINELILLACPVQEKTKKYVNHPCFKKIYSLFCENDTIQTLDPQKLHYFYLAFRTPEYRDYYNNKSPFFSERTFTDNPKLLQIKVDFANPATPLLVLPKVGFEHLEFLLPPFLQQLPTVIQQYPKSTQEIITITI